MTLNVDDVHYRPATNLLVDIGVTEKVAKDLALLHPYRRVFEVVAYAKGRPYPAGAAVAALRAGWIVPPRPEVEIEHSLPPPPPEATDPMTRNLTRMVRRAGESENDFLRRALDEKRQLMREREGVEKGGAGAQLT